MNRPLGTNTPATGDDQAGSHSRSGSYPQAFVGRVLATISEGTVITDADQNVMYVNEAFTAITGYSPNEILGKNCRILQGPGSDQATIDRIREALGAGEVFHGEVLNFREDRTSFWNALTITPVKDDAGKIAHFVSVQRDVTLEKALTEQVYFLAHHDPATGLPNRNALDLQLFEAVDRANQASGAFAVGMIDLDDFRAVNTSFDHDAGDQIIAETARRLQGQLRTTDFVARIGGDKFAVIIENLEPERVDEQIHATMAHLYQVVEEPYTLASGQNLSLGMSMGLGLFPRDATTAPALLHQADTALHEVKTAKNERTQWWSTSTTDLLPPARNITKTQDNPAHTLPGIPDSTPDEPRLLSNIEKLVSELDNTVAHLADTSSMRITDTTITSANQSAVEWIQEALEDIMATAVGLSLASDPKTQR